MPDGVPPAIPADAWLAFFRAAGALKDQVRNGWTPGGRRESVAEHSWRVALMAAALAEATPGLDRARLIELALLHDLGEALRGDVPAPQQAGDKTAAERADVATLLAPLPPAAASRLAAIWEEAAAGTSPEAQLVKAIDRLETVLTHAEGPTPPDFDHGFNLAYGRALTDAAPMVAALRAPVDAETARRAAGGAPAWAGEGPGALVFPPPPIPTVAVAGGGRYPVGRVFCVGRNYAAHAAEMGAEVDREAPFYFTKSATAVIEAGGTAPYPPGTDDYHHEVELALAIGRDGADISEADAPGFVFGCAVALDMTRRDLQAAAKAARRPWDLGKDVEGSAILAPILPVAPEGPPASGRIRLSVDGALRQDGDLAEMVWPPSALIAHISRFYRLRPGDLILTGTPAGVGAVARGARIEAQIEGLPPLAVTIV